MKDTNNFRLTGNNQESFLFLLFLGCQWHQGFPVCSILPVAQEVQFYLSLLHFQRDKRQKSCSIICTENHLYSMTISRKFIFSLYLKYRKKQARLWDHQLTSFPAAQTNMKTSQFFSISPLNFLVAAEMSFWWGESHHSSHPLVKMWDYFHC